MCIDSSRNYSLENIRYAHSCQRLSRSQGHSAAGGVILMKNSNYTVGNLNHDLPACSAVSQPTAPRRVPFTTFLYLSLQLKVQQWA
jgi:hypothetical protein